MALSQRSSVIISVAAATILIFIACILSWYGVAQSVNDVPVSLLCQTAGYNDWDCTSKDQSLSPLCCIGAKDNRTTFAVPPNWWTVLQSCSNKVHALVSQLPTSQSDSESILTRDKWIECEAGKAASSWLKYLGCVIGWVSVFLAVGNLFRPGKTLFQYSKYFAVVAIGIALVGLQQVLADANEIHMFSFEHCQDYSIPNVNGMLQLPVYSDPLYCSDTSITGDVVDNELYWHLLITMNAYCAGTVLLILSSLVILGCPYVSREKMRNMRSTGPKGVYF